MESIHDPWGGLSSVRGAIWGPLAVVDQICNLRYINVLVWFLGGFKTAFWRALKQPCGITRFGSDPHMLVVCDPQHRRIRIKSIAIMTSMSDSNAYMI